MPPFLRHRIGYEGSAQSKLIWTSGEAMRIGPIYRGAFCLLAAGLVVALTALGAPPAAAQNSQPAAEAVNPGAAMAQYRAALEDL